jgi:hypothetical protein
MTNYHSKRNAEHLAAIIRRHWSARGHSEVQAEVFEIFPGSKEPAWGVRSHLVAGLPPRAIVSRGLVREAA